MKIVIIGGHGRFGSKLLKLFSKSNEVYNVSPSPEKKVDASYHHLPGTIKTLSSAIIKIKPDYLIISYFGNPQEKEPQKYEEIIESTRIINTKVDNLCTIFLSTQLVYAKNFDIYAEYCKKLEESLKTRVNKNNSFLVLRVPIIYGIRTEETSAKYNNLIDIFISKAKKGESLSVYGDGNYQRSLIFDDDLVALIDSIIKNNVKNVVMDASLGENRSIKNIAVTIAKKYDVVLNTDMSWPEGVRKVEESIVLKSDQAQRLVRQTMSFDRFIEEL